MVLQQNDRLPIQLAGKINRLLRMDELVPVRRRSTVIGVLEETHFELRPEQTRHGRVDDFNIELAGVDQADDRFEVAVSC